MRKILDRLYQTSGVLAAVSIILIALIVALQVVLNLITKLGIPGVNLSVPSYADFSGYLLASASFFGLPYTLMKGGHIRVTLVSGAVGARLRYAMDLFALAVGLAISGGGTWYMIALNRQSWMFGDMSSGIIAIPIWLVQIPLSLGLGILTVAFADLLLRAVVTGRSTIVDAQSAE